MSKPAETPSTNNNAGKVSNLRVVQSTADEEYRFREALDQLVDAFNSEHIDSATKIEQLLNIGMQYIDMQNGVVGSVMGDSLEMICVAGDMADKVEAKSRVPLNGTLCLNVLESDEPFAVHNIPQSEYAADCIGPIDGLKSYIGTQVFTSNGPLGTLCYFSTIARKHPFTSFDFRILGNIASWIGSVVGNEEQLEFLSHQNDYYRSLFSTVPSMMMLCNEDGLILATSERLCTEIGIEPLKLPGQNCQKYFDNKDQDALNAALSAGNFEHLPCTLSTLDDRTIEVEISSCIKTIGSMRGVRMLVLSDVSERNQAIRAVEEQNKQLALVNQSLNQFACMASHDLQEPLHKIQQFSHFLADDMNGKMTEDAQYHLDVINNSALRMSTLIKDLLKFSSAAQDELNVTDVDLSTLLVDVRSELELRINETNAKIIVSSLPVIQADKSLTRQLFMNLISNSLKYRDKDREPLIKVDCDQTDDGVAITVTDNGIGFDQKLVSRAFEPFSRLHSGSEYKGNGIGLSICATVCEKHNWKLSASSKPGEGSTFTLLMPV